MLCWLCAAAERQRDRMSQCKFMGQLFNLREILCRQKRAEPEEPRMKVHSSELSPGLNDALLSPPGLQASFTELW